MTSAPSIQLDLKPPRWLRAASLVMAAITALALAAYSALPVWSVPVLLALALLVDRSWWRAQTSMPRLVLTSNGLWIARIGEGNVQLRLAGSHCVLSVQSLSFNDAVDGKPRLRLVFHRSQLPATEWRRLQVWLRSGRAINPSAGSLPSR